MAISSGKVYEQMQTAIKCDTCENTAEHLCRTCHDRLCDRCKYIHCRSKASFYHEVVQLTSEALNLSHEFPSSCVCKNHQMYPATVGCRDCEIPVCEKCLVGEHNGHKLIEFPELFRRKKEKLEKKLSTVVAELPKYEARLKEIGERQALELKNNKEVKEEIFAHFEKAISQVEEAKKHILKDVDGRKNVNLDILKVEENRFLSHIQHMKEFVFDFQSDDLQKKSSFILYTNCRIGDTMPEECPDLTFPGIVKYVHDKEGNFNIATGMLYNFLEDRPLLSAGVVVLQTIAIDEGQIQSLCCQTTNSSCTFWVYSGNLSEFRNYDRKCNIFARKEANIDMLKNKPLCVTNEGILIFRKNKSALFKSTAQNDEMFLDLTPMLPGCICSTRNGEILTGLVHGEGNFGAVARYNIKGRCCRRFSLMWKNWIPEPIFKTNKLSVYIAENINGDICLSMDMNIVCVISADGEHRFTYNGADAALSTPFLPRGICTDLLGNILIADENNHGVHILDKDGRFLTLLTFPIAESQAKPVSLCIDHKNDLCIGCSDGKIRIVKYLN